MGLCSYLGWSVSDSDLKNDVLTTASDAALMYEGECLFAGQHDDFGYVLSIVVGGGVGRNDSVVTLAKVWGDADHGERARRVQIVLCEQYKRADALVNDIRVCLADYPNVSVVLDDVGEGQVLAQRLKELGISYKPVMWGGHCFSDDNRKSYVNKRSQANVCLSRAITDSRFKITTSKHQDQIKNQVMQRPFSFDDKARFKMASKTDLQKRGIPSPDIADTFAFLFLENSTFKCKDKDVVDAVEVPHAPHVSTLAYAQKRYQKDVCLFAKEMLGIRLEQNQENWLRAASLPGGRTALSDYFFGQGLMTAYAILALWQFLLFEDAMVLFVSPCDRLMSNRICSLIQEMVQKINLTVLRDLVSGVEIKKQRVTRKGSSNAIRFKSFVHSGPCDLAGQHSVNYQIIVHHAQVCPDHSLDVLLGGLCDPANRVAVTLTNRFVISGSTLDHILPTLNKKTDWTWSCWEGHGYPIRIDRQNFEVVA